MGDARSTTLVELAEYETVEARLTPQQALLVRGSGVVDVRPSWSSGAYRRSQARILAFDGLIVPGHDEPFENHPQKTISNPPAK